MRGDAHPGLNLLGLTLCVDGQAVDPETGMLSLHGHHPTGGIEPRHFSLDPTGRWCLVAHCGELGDGATPATSFRFIDRQIRSQNCP